MFTQQRGSCSYWLCSLFSATGRNGKSIAVLTKHIFQPVSTHPSSVQRLRRLIGDAEADLKAGRLVSWDSFLRHERKRSSARH